MIRRASYMYGGLLPASPTGHVDAGLGKTIPKGTVGLIAPTEEISVTGTELRVDGIRIVFQNTPGTEAPAEMNFHFPDKKLLCMAENCSHNMHNLYTPRGAQVRDALAWSKYINQAIELFGEQTEICFASHHWPRFGRDDAIDFLTKQRDLYRWLHDQTMRLANHGFTPIEIAEQLDLPPELTTEFHTRGYYGSVNHNVKAVYQRYLGWFDGNPANLHPLPPVDAGRRYVEFMGGADALLAKAREAFDAGEYRWVAQVVNHLVFAEPDNADARHLQADALEQLGYQAESGPWRNFYLTGAQELRHGTPDLGRARPGEMMKALTVEQIFDALAVRLNGPAAAGKRINVNWRFTDLGEDHVLGLVNSAVHQVPGRHAADAQVTVTLPKTVLGQILIRDTRSRPAPSPWRATRMPWWSSSAASTTSSADSRL
jgi:alkyl sulfatase BDS1-like metallo-beta-lactamase superfamily hydrolase